MEQREVGLGRTMRDMNDDVCSLIKKGVSGLLGVEAATAYWGLSSFWPGIPIFLIDSDVEQPIFDNDWYNKLYSSDINVDNIVKLSDKLYVTDKEQTVCDMIRFNRPEFHLFETLISAYDEEVDIQRLEYLASQYGILERMKNLLEEAYRDEQL